MQTASLVFHPRTFQLLHKVNAYWEGISTRSQSTRSNTSAFTLFTLGDHNDKFQVNYFVILSRNYGTYVDITKVIRLCD
jgi:hypothetical protein